MKKIVIIIFFTSFIGLYSQGFDWYYSSRLPFQLPKTYLGANINYTYNINFFEDIPVYQKSQNNENVFDYTSLNNTNFNFGFNAEYWLYNKLAILTKLSINIHSNQFINTESIPIDSKTLWTTEQNTNLQIMMFAFSPGIKKRLFDTYFNVGLNLNLNLILNNKLESTEKSISPNWKTFSDGTKEIDSDFSLPALSKFNVSPEIFISYDYSFKIGYYLSPYLALNYQLGSYFESNQWNSFGIILGVNILKSI